MQGAKVLHEGTVIDFRSPHMQLINSSYAKWKDANPEPTVESFEAWLNATLDQLATQLGYYTVLNGNVVRRVEITGTFESPEIQVFS